MAKARFFLMLLLLSLIASRFNEKLIRSYDFDVDAPLQDTWKHCLDVLQYYAVDQEDFQNGPMISGHKQYLEKGLTFEHRVTLRLTEKGSHTGIKYTSLFCYLPSFGKSKGQCYRYANPKLSYNDNLSNIEEAMIDKTKDMKLDLGKEKLWGELLNALNALSKIDELEYKSYEYEIEFYEPINYKIITAAYIYYSILPNEDQHSVRLKMTIDTANKIAVAFLYYPGYSADGEIGYDYCQNKKHPRAPCRMLIENEDTIMKNLANKFGKEIAIIKTYSGHGPNFQPYLNKKGRPLP